MGARGVQNEEGGPDIEPLLRCSFCNLSPHMVRILSPLLDPTGRPLRCPRQSFLFLVQCTVSSVSRPLVAPSTASAGRSFCGKRGYGFTHQRVLAGAICRLICSGSSLRVWTLWDVRCDVRGNLSVSWWSVLLALCPGHES